MNKLNFQLITAVSLGNFLEWYDFGLFSAFAPLLAKLFFPETDHRTALLQVFLIFAVGFLCRPIGALLFGHFGDKVGRIKTLRTSILLISLPTVLIALLPTYEQIGIHASFWLLALRILQGISLGGEFTGIIIYLAETAPLQRRAFCASFAGTAANLGILGGMLVVFILSHTVSLAFYESLGWRLAFLSAGFISLFIVYARLSLLETPVFQGILKNHQLSALPILQAFKEVPFRMLKILGLTLFGSSLYYTCYIYLQSYWVEILHFSSQTSLFLQISSLTSMLLLVPLGGKLCDRWGRRKSFLGMTGFLLVAALPCFYLFKTGLILNAIIGMGVLTLISSMEQGTTSATVVEQFPPALRYSALSFSYNLAQALFGGTAPVIAASLLAYTHDPISPVYYLMFTSLMTFIVVFFTLKETAPIRQNQI